MATDMAVDLEKGTEETMGAPDAQLLELLSGDLLRHLLLAKHMPDLEKGIKEGMDTHAAGQVQAMAEDEEQEYLIHKDMRYHQVEGVAVVAGKMNPAGKKWLPYYWLLVAAASVIILSNHIHAAPKDQQLFPPELAMFTVLLCAIFLILLSMKQMMWDRVH